MDSIKAEHGYTLDSRVVKWLAEFMGTFSKSDRREFLEFMTGSPKLPIGGFKALCPILTVVVRTTESGQKPESYLPSVMTCAHFLKIPQYPSKESLVDKFLIAMKEGAGSFHLS